jgi:hypothetical protein
MYDIASLPLKKSKSIIPNIIEWDLGEAKK